MTPEKKLKLTVDIRKILMERGGLGYHDATQVLFQIIKAIEENEN